MLKLKLIAIFQSVMIVALLFVVAVLLMREQSPAIAEDKALPASLTAETEPESGQRTLTEETSETIPLWKQSPTNEFMMSVVKKFSCKMAHMVKSGYQFWQMFQPTATTKKNLSNEMGGLTIWIITM